MSSTPPEPLANSLKRPRSEPNEESHGETGETSVQSGATSSSEGSGNVAVAGYATNGDWVAVWSPEANAYYFWNSKTNTTTWSNPMDPSQAQATSQPDTSESIASTSDTAVRHPLPANPTLHESGIDPDLLYLDPSLSSSDPSSSGYAAKAAFNARTGRFQNDASMNPERVSEIERMKRQSQFYFDYEGWTKLRDVQQETAQMNGLAEEKRKSKRLTRKEVERYKAKKEEKKRKHQLAWLRD